MIADAVASIRVFGDLEVSRGVGDRDAVLQAVVGERGPYRLVARRPNALPQRASGPPRMIDCRVRELIARARAEYPGRNATSDPSMSRWSEAITRWSLLAPMIRNPGGAPRSSGSES